MFQSYFIFTIRKKGIIINLSSVICICPSPLAIIYGATKVMVDETVSRDIIFLFISCTYIGVYQLFL